MSGNAPELGAIATGAFFYKYSSLARPEQLEWLKSILHNHELYLPSLDQLNDPADGRPALAPLSESELISFLYESFKKANPNAGRAYLKTHEHIIRINVHKHGTERLQRLLSESLNKELEGYRVYSLSKRYNNLSLWAKYANNHTGYCLEFANTGVLFSSVREVRYGDCVKMDLNSSEHRSGYWFFWKRRDWSNEEEVRLVVQRGKGSRVKIDSGWLTRLILGEKMSNINRETISRWAEERDPQLSVVNAYFDPLDQTVKLKI